MTKLTEAQMAVLTSASERTDGAATPSRKMTGVAAAKIAAGLAARKLMREVLSKPRMPVWRQDGQGRSLSLVLLKAGREAVEVDGTASATPGKASVRATGKQTSASEKSRQAASMQAAGLDGANANARSAAALQPAATSAPQGSKRSQVIAMLLADAGTTLDDLVRVTGWLPHTTRAALTGLRKKGLRIERERAQGSAVSVYRIRPQTSFAEPDLGQAA